jgi:hypothetical protein
MALVLTPLSQHAGEVGADLVREELADDTVPALQE